MFKLYKKIFQPKTSNQMKWKELNSINDLETALKASHEQPVALFKHSTRCSVSLMAKKSVERFWDLDIDAYYLDLIAHRDVSNSIAEQLEVQHQSPQMVLVKDGKAIYNASHGSIDVDAMGELL
ncbi:MAG: Pyridoxamine 5'-phosphate oxidase (EC [uncultured Aureispira sp.]|uniref:Pyridoxamine 5'-phosphate oxidase (EC) n=1 Tax=uncultured Aureispira sp. TaxID=1331704 RepID=A0A6S6RS10_9BACT|nr:MAG: Pyridoxamine 5'-phosphate oxidase (EC [uncultured Aureispira sp.]